MTVTSCSSIISILVTTFMLLYNGTWISDNFYNNKDKAETSITLSYGIFSYFHSIIICVVMIKEKHLSWTFRIFHHTSWIIGIILGIICSIYYPVTSNMINFIYHVYVIIYIAFVDSIERPIN